MALAHKVLIAAFHVLENKVPYRELGAGYFDPLKPVSTAQNLIRRLKRLGYKVQIERAT